MDEMQMKTISKTVAWTDGKLLMRFHTKTYTCGRGLSLRIARYAIYCQIYWQIMTRVRNFAFNSIHQSTLPWLLNIKSLPTFYMITAYLQLITTLTENHSLNGRSTHNSLFNIKSPLVSQICNSGKKTNKLCSYFFLSFHHNKISFLLCSLHLT